MPGDTLIFITFDVERTSTVFDLSIVLIGAIRTPRSNFTILAIKHDINFNQ